MTNLDAANSAINIQVNVVKKRNRNVIIPTIILILFLSISGLGVYLLVFYTTNKNEIDTTQNITPTPDPKYAQLQDQTCRLENEYQNLIILNQNVPAYDRSFFYTENFDKSEIKALIPSTEHLFVELILWEDSDKDKLTYTGKALVCIKNYNKIATIEFTTDNALLKNPVRYKDPEQSIGKVLIQAIYVVPNGADAKPMWKTYIESNLKNIQKAQSRIFNNKSDIDYKIYPEVVNATELQRDALTNVARGIVNKDKKNSNTQKPIDYLDNNIYIYENEVKYPNFFVDNESNYYNQVTTIVYYEVGKNTEGLSESKKYESGYAGTSPLLSNGNYFSIIGVNLSRDISLDSSPYHEFVHTLGLPDEYKYLDGTIQRIPQHIFKSVKMDSDTLMEYSRDLDLNNTYIDDQERIMMGIKD
ncbi:MAG: hypothetical protein WCJ19_04075 [bacterium]